VKNAPEYSMPETPDDSHLSVLGPYYDPIFGSMPR